MLKPSSQSRSALSRHLRGFRLLSALTLAAPLVTAAHIDEALGSERPVASQLDIRAGTGIAPDDIWLVGTAEPDASTTIARHWDGTAWSSVPTHDPGKEFNALFDVDSSSSNDVWAVGAYSSPDTDRTSLVEHWNGTKWKVMEVPDPSGADQLLSVNVLARIVHGSLG